MSRTTWLSAAAGLAVVALYLASPPPAKEEGTGRKVVQLEGAAARGDKARVRSLAAELDVAGDLVTADVARIVRGFNRIGAFDEATARADTWLQTHDATAELLLERGLSYQERGRAEDAERDFRAAAAADPRQFRAPLLLGNLLRHKGQLADALALLRHSTELAPEAADAHHALGLVHEKLGDPAAALPAYEASVRLRPTDPEMLTNLGALHHKQGRRNEAAARYREALAAAPDFERARRLLAKLESSS